MQVRKGRGNKYIPPKLSQKDEGVPDGYVGLYDMFVISEDVRRCYGEQKAQELRKKTYENVARLYDKYGSMDFARFWNLHIHEINHLKLNEFARFDKLADLCNYIKCFTEMSKYNGTPRTIVSFGLKIEHLRKYAEEKERCAKEGIEFLPPIFRERVREVNKDLIDFGSLQLELINGDSSTKTTIVKNEIYKRFEHWRTIKNLKRGEAFKLAMKEIVDNHPIKDVGTLEDYKVVTEFDKVCLVAKKNKYGTASVLIQLDKDVHEKMNEIIYRYNEDSENKAYKVKNVTEYAREAIERMNEQMPLKYTDPEKWQEYLKIQNELKKNESEEENA